MPGERTGAASHKDLDELVRRGLFREDLYYRLCGVQLHVPPLRERPEEIVPLALRFLANAASEAGIETPTLCDETIDLVHAYPWPGNVRELRNAMERAAVIASGDEVRPEDMPDRIRRFAEPRNVEAAPVDAAVSSASASSTASTVTALLAGGGIFPHGEDVDLKKVMRDLEARLIEVALQQSSGNQTVAAKRLKMPLRTLVYKIRDMGLRKPDGT